MLCLAYYDVYCNTDRKEDEIGKMLNLEKLNREAFQTQLLTWYDENKRDLPWRNTQDPYHIWVSEIMLQQTRVETVIPYFENFIERFPTLDALAEADEEDVLKAWEGLGYYSRARNLQAAVREVKESYGGVVPNHEEDIATLKGVGPYTAGAILSIAYGKPVPAVDGNVMRVLSRVLLVYDDISKVKTRKMFESAVRKLIPNNAASNFNQALMELGATVCTPKSPGCLLCPVRSECRSFYEGVQAELPVKAKKKRPKLVPIAVAVLENANGQFLITKRPNEGLLANLWEFPNCEVDSKQQSKKQLEQFFKKSWGIHVDFKEKIFEFEHIFSHLIWELDVYRGTLHTELIETEEVQLVGIDDFERYPFSVTHKKIIRRLAE